MLGLQIFSTEQILLIKFIQQTPAHQQVRLKAVLQMNPQQI